MLKFSIGNWELMSWAESGIDPGSPVILDETKNQDLDGQGEKRGREEEMKRRDGMVYGICVFKAPKI